MLKVIINTVKRKVQKHNLLPAESKSAVKTNNSLSQIKTGIVKKKPTRTAEFLALDLSNAFVGEPARASAASTACLDGVGAQVVGQPLEVTVTDKWVLGQVAGERDQKESQTALLVIFILKDKHALM